MQKRSNGKNLTHISTVKNSLRLKLKTVESKTLKKLVVKNLAVKNSLQESVSKESYGKINLQKNIQLKIIEQKKSSKKSDI